MPCKVAVDRDLKSAILDCDDEIRKEVGDFLLNLQEFPLPEGRHERMSMGAYFYQLPCGYFVSWEILGSARDIIQMTFLKETKDITVRLIGFARRDPSKQA